MTEEIFEEGFYLSTSKPTQIITESRLREIYKDKSKGELKQILTFFKEDKRGPIPAKKNVLYLKSSKGKIYKVFITLGYEFKLKDKQFLDEDIYQNLKSNYKDFYKIIPPPDKEEECKEEQDFVIIKGKKFLKPPF
jgi:hypothetical protein